VVAASLATTLMEAGNTVVPDRLTAAARRLMAEPKD
jgi:hypothetical protein